MDTVATFQFHLTQLPTHSRLRRASRSIAVKASSVNLNVSTRASSNGNFVLHTLKRVCLTMAVTAALLLARCSNSPAISVPAAVPLVEKDKESDQVEDEMVLQEKSCRNPIDKESLRQLIQARIKSRDLLDAMEVLNMLIDLEPEEVEWRLVKSQIHTYNGEMEEARRGFEEILKCDPFRVEAYHGLVMMESELGYSLNGIVARIGSTMDKCREEKRNVEVKELKMVMAHAKVMQGEYGEALRVYGEMVKEEPNDFRPYLCQAIIYSLLGDNNAAAVQLQQFRRLVPANHPCREYFFGNLFAFGGH